jgi:hypothetical protein
MRCAETHLLRTILKKPITRYQSLEILIVKYDLDQRQHLLSEPELEFGGVELMGQKIRRTLSE